MKRIIKWHSQHLEIDAMSGKLDFEDDDDDESFDDEYFDDANTYMRQELNVQNVMSTPFGLWRVDDSMHPYRQFKLWMAYTNFSITAKIVDIIKNIPGVEVLQIMTRYRFIVGVGELFDIHDVRIAIEKELMCNRDEQDMIGNQEILQQVTELKNTLNEHNQWAIYVFPNGKIDFTTSESEDFVKTRNIFRQAVDYSNGVLIESE